MKLHVSPLGHDLVSRAILITGLGRSGTTLVGRLIASCKFVEYAFEPPVLISLFSQLGKVPSDSWKLLFTTYLYEEVFVNGIAGRSINLNPNDDSSAWGTLGEKEVNRRLQRSWRKHEIESLLYTTREVSVAYKIPSLVQYLPTFLELYPDARVLHVVRGLLPTIASFLSKGWFREDDSSDLITAFYPYSVFHSIRVPFWVKADHVEWWAEAKELERCLYYYSLNIHTNQKQVMRLAYEDLTRSPESTFEKLLRELNLEQGEETRSILQKVHRGSFTMGPESQKLISEILMCLPRLPKHCITTLTPYLPDNSEA